MASKGIILIGGALAVVFGAAVIASRKGMGRKVVAVGVASLVIGLVFGLDAGMGPLYKPLLQVVPLRRECRAPGF